MTKRFVQKKYWAEDGIAKDPDLDTSHPSYKSNRYEGIGWGSEKPPEEWQNFIQQCTDLKILERMQLGVHEYQSSISYGEGSLFSRNGKLYTVTDGVQTECSLLSNKYTDLISELNLIYSKHLNSANPHKDTVNSIIGGTYSKSDVDSKLGSETDSSTIAYHIKRVGAVHGETAAKLGILRSTSTGAFTGDVGFDNGISLSSTQTKSLKLNPIGGRVELTNGTNSFGLDVDGKVYINKNGVDFQVVTTNNIDEIIIRAEHKFALPPKIIGMNIEESVNDVNSVGMWTITTSSTPVFESGKGFVLQSSNKITGFDIKVPHTVVLVGYGSVIVTDVNSSKTYSDLKDFVTSTDFKYVKQLDIYPTLTALQKSTLVNK